VAEVGAPYAEAYGMRWLSRTFIATLIVAAACTSPHSPTDQPTGPVFKVATWNIRSGMGIRGFGSTAWSHDTLNCTDRTKPKNAWGIGLPQAELERLRADPSIAAVAIQEAWNCAAPDAINAILGFRTATRQEEGVMLLARHGFAGPPKYERIDLQSNRRIVGGDVCLDPACAATMPMFSAHFGGNEDDLPAQAGRTLEWLRSERQPHLFMGDLNVFKVDTWNPSVPCTGSDNASRMSTIAMIENAGYTDAWKQTQRGEGWTGMASRRGCGSPDGGLYKRVDYVYTIGLQVVATTRFGRAAPGGDSPSDHAGVIATLARPN
jgi:endonuclease/exonuclease/phosphatase family metal-dependent hydrolase